MAKKYLCNISKMICMQNNNKITIICRQNDTDNMFYSNDKNNVQAANKLNVYANENNIRDLPSSSDDNLKESQSVLRTTNPSSSILPAMMSERSATTVPDATDDSPSSVRNEARILAASAVYDLFERRIVWTRGIAHR